MTRKAKAKGRRASQSSYVPVPREFFKPGAVAFLVNGDCMDPEVPHGSFVLVDTQDTALEEGGIYVLNTRKGGFVKRAVRRGEEWRFEPDNKDEVYPSFRLEEVEVIGRVYGVVFSMWPKPRFVGQEE